MKNLFKNKSFMLLLLGVGVMLVSVAVPAFADVYTDTDAALDTAIAAIGPLLIVGLGIPLAFLGFKVAKRIIRSV